MNTKSGQSLIYELSGGGIKITYSTTSFAGPPTLSFERGGESQSFFGKDILVQEAPLTLGSLVSVKIGPASDGADTTFTLLIPTTPAIDSTPIKTYGIETQHKGSLTGEILEGQGETYKPVEMNGTADRILA